MISDLLQKAREYEAAIDRSIALEDRPTYHLSSRAGWMNDPNGFSCYRGEYHLFYQYYPYKTQWGPMHWGHAVSHDLIHWDYRPAALAPDEAYDSHGCFSGSAYELSDGRQLLMYTGTVKENGEPEPEKIRQKQCLAFGDGTDYEKWEQNPVLGQKDLPEGFTIYDFRDPKLFRQPDGKLSCVIGAHGEAEKGAVLLYESSDAIHWHFVSVLDESRGLLGNVWECPDLISLDGKSVLIVSPTEMEPEGLEFHKGSNSLAVIGTLDPKSHRLIREGCHALDYGIDFYAPQTCKAPDGRTLMIAWMQSWDTCAQQPEGTKWFGQMTLPRELTLRSSRVFQSPVREIEALRREPVIYAGVSVSGEMTLPGVEGRVLDLTVTVHPNEGQTYQGFTLKFAKDRDHYCSLSYDPSSSVLCLSRAHSGMKEDKIPKRCCYVADRKGELKLRILFDRFSAEVFVNDGEQTMSMTFYTPLTADAITFEAEGSAMFDLEKYRIEM